jgi:hypothetical protein
VTLLPRDMREEAERRDALAYAFPTAEMRAILRVEAKLDELLAAIARATRDDPPPVAHHDFN